MKLHKAKHTSANGARQAVLEQEAQLHADAEKLDALAKKEAAVQQEENVAQVSCKNITWPHPIMLNE